MPLSFFFILYEKKVNLKSHKKVACVSKFTWPASVFFSLSLFFSLGAISAQQFDINHGRPCGSWGWVKKRGSSETRSRKKIIYSPRSDFHPSLCCYSFLQLKDFFPSSVACGCEGGDGGKIWNEPHVQGGSTSCFFSISTRLLKSLSISGIIMFKNGE